ncbi:MAG TPA: hypothetical protein VNU93_06705, partial [Verrucomicrobiae bacterium]|nr:hypothetical protein [Verrucomicrobiae bacterium]
MPDVLAPVTQREKYAYPLLLFLLFESLIYLVFVEGYSNHQLFSAYTIVLCLALATTHLQLVLRVYVSNLIVGSISILFMVYNTYFLTEITDPTWLKLLFLDIQASFNSLWNGKMYAEETVTTLLGMCFVWFIAQRSLKTFVRQRRIMVLFLAGLILQGILFSYVQRTFSAANVIYMIAGLLLLSLSRLANLEEAWKRQGVRGGGDIVLNWAGKAVALICLVVAIGAWLPAAEASILQDNARLRSITDWVMGSQPVGGDVKEADSPHKDETKGKNTSFGWSDKTLGGPWTPHKSPAMTVVSARDLYWRGGAKEIYTGQGWENAPLPASNVSEAKGPVYQGIKTEYVEQTMRMSQQ